MKVPCGAEYLGVLAVAQMWVRSAERSDRAGPAWSSYSV